MIVCTTERPAGRRIVKSLGLVRGNTIRARFIGKDILAHLRNLTGGEVVEYTRMMAVAREEAVDRMIQDAEALGADAIVAVRFSTAMIMTGAAEMMCYGTALVTEPEIE